MPESFKKAGLEGRESILVALAGLSPAVITETVWALAHMEIPIVPKRIIVITTQQGRERVVRQLFEEGAWEPMREKLLLKLSQREAEKGGIGNQNLQHYLKLGPVPDSIRVIPQADYQKELNDVRTAEDNAQVADFLLENLRPFTENAHCRIIGSIAGGRKTMGALLHSVMSLLGRADDRLVHVLVEEPWDRLPGFLYPGCAGNFCHPETGETLDTGSAYLDLAEIPFIPLRPMFESELQKYAGSYLELVREVRRRALSRGEDTPVFADPEKGFLRIGDQSLEFNPREYVYYLAFLKRASEGEKPLLQAVDMDAESLRELAREYRRQGDFSHWANQFLENSDNLEDEDGRKMASSIRTKLKKAGFDKLQIDRLVPRRGRLSIDLDASLITLKN